MVIEGSLSDWLQASPEKQYELVVDAQLIPEEEWNRMQKDPLIGTYVTEFYDDAIKHENQFSVVLGAKEIGPFKYPRRAAISRFSMVSIPDTAVVNVVGTKHDARVRSWVRFWEVCWEVAFRRCKKRKCFIAFSKPPLQYHNPISIVGGHVREAGVPPKDRDYFLILPICKTHNKINAWD